MKPFFNFVICSLIISKTFSYKCFDEATQDNGSFVEQVYIRFWGKVGEQIASVPDDDLSTPEIIKKDGYTVEVHQVKTEDGYILNLERIPGTGKAVLVQHGLFGTSAGFVLTGKNRSLAYLLADQNYDVWMGNLRGSAYSLCHENLSIKDSRYWDFSFHEIGLYDIPAFVIYITEFKKDKILYVGHSMGTTAFYVMASMRPEVAEKVTVMFSLAPVAFMNHLETPLRFVAPFSNPIKTVADYFRVYNFHPLGQEHKLFVRYYCDLNVFEENICAYVFFLVIGFDINQWNIPLSPKIWNHIPAGSSLKTLTHYGQLINSGYFRQFDNGEALNKIKYNSSEPPDYDLGKIKTPIGLLYSENDYITSVIDVQRLKKKLKNVILDFVVPFANFNHIDFLWGLNAKEFVYNQLIAAMEEWRSK